MTRGLVDLLMLSLALTPRLQAPAAGEQEEEDRTTSPRPHRAHRADPARKAKRKAQAKARRKGRGR